MAGYIGSKTSVTVTSPETDSRYVNVTGDTMTGALTVGGAFTSLGIDDNATSTAMTLDSSGNVGIGTTSPAFPISVSKTNGTYTDFETVFDGSISGGGGESSLSLSVQGDALGAYVSSNLTFSDNVASQSNVNRNSSFIKFGNATSGSRGTISFGGTGVGSTTEVESMRIDSSGNLLVGTTSTPSSTNAGVRVNPNNTDITQISRGLGTDARTMIALINGNGTVGTIRTSASSTSYNTSSDYRLKEDVQPMTGASDRVLALNPVNFAWKVDGSRVDGFLAHEAQAVVPEAVTGSKDAVDAEGNPEYQGIDQSKLVPLLTAALQEALTEIADLKARVTALETV